MVPLTLTVNLVLVYSGCEKKDHSLIDCADDGTK